ncbi:PcfK-like family protein [Flavobacterium crassostreae]|uniref:PcfK-like protein n=1 Tax=Flavobacterium crassostreae TaxID=1763534 RepID=A0A1B9E800_9FLAO|nr:Cas9 inhibitor AcrIIA9 family protein [Flavobacterium crassostreae]OCB77988.1 hypothetical protein LPBF_03300 [Flavobacterium crassostreae]
MKASNAFKETIKTYLDKLAAEDELFAETYKKENKNLDECCNYVMQCAKNGGSQGYADEEVFGWAVHYYDEDDVKNIKAVSGKVVINRSVKLTEEEKAQAKEKAMDMAVAEAKEDAKKALVGTVELTEEDLKDVKQKAIDKVVDEEKDKLTRKPKTTKTEGVKPVQQLGLF